MDEFANACQEAARLGGQILVDMRGRFTPREKAPADLVTEADIASQTAIRDLLLGRFPHHHFVGEEDLDGDDGPGSAECTWIVDPLDGTTNYVHGMENYCVSVALQRGNETVVGSVYDPLRDKCFRATLGAGAFCNDEPLAVSRVDSLGQALVAASLPPKVRRDEMEVRLFLDVMERCQAVRRLGSAALNLCFVANGCLDAYWATCVKKWDVAAGLLIVREAGGTVTHLDGGDLDLEKPHFVVAARPALHAELVSLFSRRHD